MWLTFDQKTNNKANKQTNKQALLYYIMVVSTQVQPILLTTHGEKTHHYWNFKSSGNLHIVHELNIFKASSQ